MIMAKMVPMGMDFWALARSPDRLEPAIIPANEELHLMKIMKLFVILIANNLY